MLATLIGVPDGDNIYWYEAMTPAEYAQAASDPLQNSDDVNRSILSYYYHTAGDPATYRGEPYGNQRGYDNTAGYNGSYGYTGSYYGYRGYSPTGYRGGYTGQYNGGYHDYYTGGYREGYTGSYQY